MKEQKTTKWSNFNPLCLARHVLRNLWMTVLAGLICVMAVYLLQTLVSKPSYDSQVTFAVTSRSASATASGSIAVTDSVASQFGELLQSNPVRTAAAAEMGLNAFPGTCSVDVPENTNILILTVTAPTPELAFRGALAVMDCYESYADFILASAVLNPINGPTLPSQPSAQASRDRLLRLAGPIGALAMIAVLLLLAVSQETVQTVPGARDQLDTKLLATLRHERKRGALLRNKKSALLISDPTCSFYYTETVHQLRAQVERAHEKDGRQVFLITSCAENEGKSTVAANLALSLAQKHQRVLLLDADLRKPAQSLIFSASPAPAQTLAISSRTARTARRWKRPLSVMKRPACPISTPRRCAAARARRSARIHSVRCSMRCARAIPTFSSTRHPSASSPMPRCGPMQPMPRSAASGRTSSPPPSLTTPSTI